MRGTPHRTAEDFNKDDIHYQICFKGTAVITSIQINLRKAQIWKVKNTLPEKTRNVTIWSQVEGRTSITHQKKGVDKMKERTLIVTEIRTNTIHVLIITIQNPGSTVLHHQKAA